MDRDWLERLIQKSAWDLEASRKTIFQFGSAVARALGKCPLQDWEAKAWSRGLNLGLLRIEGHFFRAGSGKRSPLCFFVRNEKDLYVGLRRESITQAALYVSLVTDYGYSRAHTHFEARWMDVAVYGESGEALIYAETKSSARTLEKLCARLASEFQDGPPPADPGDLQIDDAVMKARHILKNRPRYFWGVSPGSRQSFQIRYNPRGFVLEDSPCLPNALEWTERL